MATTPQTIPPRTAAAVTKPGAQSPSLVETPTRGFTVGLAYLLDVLSRLPEFTIAIVGSALFQSPVLLVFSLLFAFLNGRILEVLHIPVGRWLLAYVGWLAVTLPFSYWKSASLLSYTYTVRHYLLFLITVTLVRTMTEVRKATTLLSFAPIPILIAIRFMGDEDGGRLQLSFGSFANSNELASYLIMLAPLSLLVASMKRYNWVLRGLSLLLCLGCLATASRTGSRGALFSLGVVLLLLLVSYNFEAKLKLLLAMVPLSVIFVAMIPEEAAQRYITAFKQQETLGDSATALQQSALASTESRKELFRQSLELTMENPLVGVGIGTFAAANAAKSGEIGQRALWQVSHNAYTQISSEAGLPALCFYLGACLYLIRGLWRVSRRPQRGPWHNPGYAHASVLEETRQQALHLLLAFTAVLTYGMFASTAGDFTFFILMGLGTSFLRAQAEQANAAQPAAPAPAAERGLLGPAVPQRPTRAPWPEVRPDNTREKPVYPPVQRLGRSRSNES